MKLNRIRKSLFGLLFGGSGRGAKTLDLWVLAAILVSVIVVMLRSVPEIGPAWSGRLRLAEIAFTLIFSVEYLLRLLCHPRPWQYAFSFFGLVDFVAIVPTWLVFVFPSWDALAVLRIVRVFRVFRVFSLGRFSRAAATIAGALQASRYKIAAFFGGVVLVSLVAGSLMYLLEGPRNGFTSIPASTYWAVITMTTVGHGSVMPVTVAGQLLTAVLVIAGYAVVAIPVGIVTSEVVAAKNARRALLDGRETERREFKSSAFVSYGAAPVPEKVLFEASVLKPVAGFLNGRGGTLFIGVDDGGKVLGIQRDLDRKRWDQDVYVRHLTERIGGAISGAATALTTITIETLEEREICIVEVEPSPDPMWLKKSGRHAFYVRTSNSTRELRGPDLLSYIRKRWD